MPQHSLELLLDDAGDAAVRGCWQRLRDAGLPSQADHASPSNAPHVTVVEAPRIDPGAVAGLPGLLGLLPCPVTLPGLVVLGSDPCVLALAVGVPDEVLEAAARVRQQVGTRGARPWLPHLTLARRLPRADLPAALATVDPIALPPVAAASVRWWDPQTRVSTPLPIPALQMPRSSSGLPLRPSDDTP